MLAKEREVQKIEDKAAEELKQKQSQDQETQNVNKNLQNDIIINDFWQRSFKVISAEIINLIKNKNDEARPFTIRETEYDFVDPCPEEMKQVFEMLLMF